MEENELPEYDSPNDSHDQLRCLSKAASECGHNPYAALELLNKIRSLLNSNDRELIAPICDAILVCACHSLKSIKGRPDRNNAKVYFFRRDDGRIKIGFSSNVNKRCGQLKAGAGSVLETLLIIDGGAPKEFELHNKFAPDNHHGEWFNPSAELLAFIEMHKLDQTENS